jgi:hypothetical protein
MYIHIAVGCLLKLCFSFVYLLARIITIITWCMKVGISEFKTYGAMLILVEMDQQ